MTDKTATQNLTRTTASDDPKQMAAYLKQLATDADQRMAAHFFDLNRSVTPPFAVLRLYTPVQVDALVIAPGAPSPGSVPFDTVEIDTAGLVDLSANAYQIALTETGWWWVGGYAFINGFGTSTNADSGVIVRANGAVVPDLRHDGLLGFFGAGASGPVTRITDVTTARPACLTVTWNGGSTTSITTVNFAELWVCKVRDL